VILKISTVSFPAIIFTQVENEVLSSTDEDVLPHISFCGANFKLYAQHMD
jgi:hypothetical protein